MFSIMSTILLSFTGLLLPMLNNLKGAVLSKVFKFFNLRFFLGVWFKSLIIGLTISDMYVKSRYMFP